MSFVTPLSKNTRPGAGLYRTTVELARDDANGQRQVIAPAGRLVFFQDVTEHNKPAILLPEKVVDNRWSFQSRGYLVEEENWPATLVPLLRQGFYSLKRDLNVGQGNTLPKGLLVQLGYTGNGEGVVFPGYLRPGNAIAFPAKGARISDLQFDALQVHEFMLLADQPGEAK